MMKKISRSRISTLILCLLCVLFPTFQVFAEDPEMFVGEETSLSLNYEAGKGTFALYKVADFSETGKFTVEDPFLNYQVKIEEMDSEGWRALAETLAGYVQRDHLKALDKKETDDQGKIEWKQLKKGLYLVIGEQTKDEQYLYTPVPLLVTLPNRDQKGEWEYQISVSPKYNKEDFSQKQEIDFNVVKVWKDEENKKKRPEKIDVQLLKDGKVYDTIELNKENNWQYRWENLPLQSWWTVVEREIPQNYTVTCTQENNDFIITNTYVAPKVNVDKEGSVHQKLPQTGQLWWPVPVLSVLGVLLFIIGFRKYRK